MDRLKYLEDRKDALLAQLETVPEDSYQELEIQGEIASIEDEIKYLNDDSDEEYEKLVDDRANLN